LSEPKRFIPDPDPTQEVIPDPTIQVIPDPGQNLPFRPSQIKDFLKNHSEMFNIGTAVLFPPFYLIIKTFTARKSKF